MMRKNKTTCKVLSGVLFFSVLSMLSCKSEQVQEAPAAEADAQPEPDNSYFLERDKWEQADKNSLESLNKLKDSFTSEEMRQTATNYIYDELDKEIRQYAKKQGLPEKYHELNVCIVSTCKELMLYEVFRKFAIAPAQIKSTGVANLKATVKDRVVVLKFSQGKTPIQFHFSIYENNATLFMLIVGKDKSMDAQQVGELGGGIVDAFSEWPPEDEIDFKGIDRQRRGKRR